MDFGISIDHEYPRIPKNDFQPKMGRRPSWWPLNDVFRHGAARSIPCDPRPDPKPQISIDLQPELGGRGAARKQICEIDGLMFRGSMSRQHLERFTWRSLGPNQKFGLRSGPSVSSLITLPTTLIFE